jgi:carbon monoxide dehydrogenase subunit G
MKLSNQFVVNAPLAQVWALFDQLERVVPCMPGAAYLGQDGEEHRVGMKVKIGAVVSNFQGTVRFLEKDAGAHVAVMRGAAKDSGGKGSASSVIETRLAEVSPGQTRVDVVTDLTMTGRLAQFGGSIVADIAQRLVQQFTANLHEAILAQTPAAPASETAAQGVSAASAATDAGEAHAPATTLAAAPPDVKPLDLGAVIGQSVCQNAGRYIVFLAIGFVLGWFASRGW